MMAFLRTWHSYLSVFVAPSIIFFALTGALQVFRLHEAHKGYQPPVLIEKLGRLHKDQVFAREERHEPAVEDAPVPPMRPHDEAAPGAQEESEPEPLPTLLLKWFFLAGAVVLALTSSLGLWIGLTHFKRKRLSWLLLLGGTLVPVTLLFV